MADVFGVAQVLIAHAVRVHGDAVAIIAYYGSRARGTASPTSDLDLFYIPDEGKAESLSSQFVLDGLPYDLWPVSWRAAEQIANAGSNRPWAFSASLVADAQVLHARSSEDLARFRALQARIAELTTPEQRGFMVRRALEEFAKVLYHLGQMRLALAHCDQAGLHWAGFELAGSTVNCLALVNQVYLRQGWGAGLSEVLQWTQRPADLECLLASVVLPAAPDVAVAQAERLATEVRAVLAEAQRSLAQTSDPGVVFRDCYFFVCEYVGKVVAACERGQPVAAASAALSLQHELCQAMHAVANGSGGSDFNLLGEYADSYQAAGFPDLLGPASQGDLCGLAARARELDQKVRAWLEWHRVALNVLGDEDDLRRFLNQRDPA